MSRGLTAGNITTVTGEVVHFAYLVELDFVDTPVYLWSGSGNLTYDGKTWLGIGAIASISSAEESFGQVAKDVQLSLVGQGTGIYSAAMSDSRQMQGRFATVTAAWMNEAFDTVAYAYQLQRLIMDTMTVEDVMDNGGIRVTINCVDELVDMGGSSSAYYSDANQKALHPDDTFFRFIATLPGKDIKWAQKSALTNSGNTGRVGTVDKANRMRP
jgi:hypothetical protein